VYNLAYPPTISSICTCKYPLGINVSNTRSNIAGARLPPSWVSPGTAPHGVAAADTRWPVRVSHRRVRVRERLRVVWRRLETPLHLGVIACQCTSPTIVGESGNGSARCGGGRQAPPPPVQAWTIARVRLPLLRASQAKAPCGVAAVASTSSDQACTLAVAPPSYLGGSTGALPKVLGESSAQILASDEIFFLKTSLNYFLLQSLGSTRSSP
jgi:hypothetical protein